MFRRRRKREEPDVVVENVTGRLRDVLALPGPNDDKIGHHRTQHGNTDPTRRGLAVGSRRHGLRLQVARLTNEDLLDDVLDAPEERVASGRVSVH